MLIKTYSLLASNSYVNDCFRVFIFYDDQVGFRQVEAPGQPLCGGPQYFKDILFKVKEMLLSVSCKYVIVSEVVH